MSITRAILYDPRADYKTGQLVYVLHPVYGTSLAKVKDRSEVAGGCRVEFEFLDPEFSAKWMAGRKTPYWAVNTCPGFPASTVHVKVYRTCVNHEADAHAAVNDGRTPRPMGAYRRLLLRHLETSPVITVADLKAAVRAELVLSDADWQRKQCDPRKVIWLERMHAALHHLNRRGVLVRVGRGVYRQNRP